MNTISRLSKTFTFGSNGNEVSVTANGRKQIARASEIYDASNDEGTIQASDARELFGRPENHTTMTLAMAFRIAGFEISEE